MTPGERIRERRQALGLTVEALAERTGLSPATIYRYEAGDISHMRADKLQPISRALRVAPAWLMGWEDEWPEGLRPLASMKRQAIPLIGEVAAGVPILAEQDYEAWVDADDALRADYALTVRGDSMAPTYLDGDVLFVREQPDVDNGTVAVVLVDDSASVKHVYHEADGVTLTSDNPAYPPMRFRLSEHDVIRILGVVVGYMRVYKGDPLKGVRKGMAVR